MIIIRQVVCIGSSKKPVKHTQKSCFLPACLFPRSLFTIINKKMKEMGVKKGCPDIAIFYNGKTLFIEFKSVTGKLSEAQKSLFPEFAKQGHTVHIVRSLEVFQQIVNQFINQ